MHPPSVNRAVHLYSALFNVTHDCLAALDLGRLFYSVTCPEKSLFEPEITIRDFCEFDQFSGHALSYILGLRLGDQILSRGQRAFNAIGAVKMALFISEFLKVAEVHGLKFPDPLPDPWLDHLGSIDEELMALLEKESQRLCLEIDPYEDHPAGYFRGLLVDHVMEHIDLLRRRKPREK